MVTFVGMGKEHWKHPPINGETIFYLLISTSAKFCPLTVIEIVWVIVLDGNMINAKMSI